MISPKNQARIDVDKNVDKAEAVRVACINMEDATVDELEFLVGEVYEKGFKRGDANRCADFLAWLKNYVKFNRNMGSNQIMYDLDVKIKELSEGTQT